VLAIFLPVTAVLYISAEAPSPKGTDQVISTTATALKVLPIAARHPAQLYVAGSLALPRFGGPAVSYAAIAVPVAQRSGLVLVGPFVRNGKTSMMQRLLLRVAMAPPWAAISWKSYLPKLYAGRGQRISASTAIRSWRAFAGRDTRRRSPALRALATTRLKRGWPMSRHRSWS
jgi:hypothetical protein